MGRTTSCIFRGAGQQLLLLLLLPLLPPLLLLLLLLLPPLLLLLLLLLLLMVPSEVRLALGSVLCSAPLPRPLLMPPVVSTSAPPIEPASAVSLPPAVLPLSVLPPLPPPLPSLLPSLLLRPPSLTMPSPSCGLPQTPLASIARLAARVRWCWRAARYACTSL